MSLAEALREIDELLDVFIQGEPVPGVAYGVIRDGEILHSRGVGTTTVTEDHAPTADTIFRIASMTKSFTAATMLLLRDDGLLNLDDHVSAYVTELAGTRPITLRQLLTMSSGLPTDDPWGDRQQGLELERFAEFLAGGQSFAWAPGTEFEYSNLGYGILGRVITNVAGSEYRDVVRSRLLEPLGMTSTAFEAAELPSERVATGYTRRDDEFIEEPFDGYGALSSMGGLFSSVRDLSRWVDGFARTEGAREHPLRTSSRLEMQQAHRAMRPELTWTSIAEVPTGSVAGYGLGLFVRQDFELGSVIEHSGGYPGFGSNMRWHPASGLGVVMLGNRTYFPAIRAAEQMLRTLVRNRTSPTRHLTPAPALAPAREAIERLLASWDDELASATFSMNVDMDEPIGMRRAAAQKLKETHGAFQRSDEPPRSDSPLHLQWWLECERGRMSVEIKLDPQPRPKVQYLEVRSVPDPDPRLRRAAARLVASVNDESPEGDAILVRALFGRCDLGLPTASDDSGATYRVTAARGELDLVLLIDKDVGDISSVTWRPCPVRPPLFNGGVG